MVIPQPEPPTPWDEFKAGLPDTWDEFITEIAAGSHMAAFCKARGINYTTLLKFTHADPSRSEMYARAREDRADVLADEIVDIADEHVATAPAATRNKLRVDARKWAASKLRPRVYGDRLELNGTVNHKSMPDEVLLQRLAAFGVTATITPNGMEAGDDA